MSATATPLAQPAAITGTVNAEGPDGQPFRIPGVAVQLVRSDGPPTVVYTNDVGEYAFEAVSPGAYTLEATLQGFDPFRRSLILRPDQTLVTDVWLKPARVLEEVTVVAGGGDGLQARQTAPSSEIKQQTLQRLPLSNEQYQSALPLVPGVIRGPDGRLNMNGTRESQSGLRVNSASVADPVTGEFAFRLPVEAVRSVQVMTNPYAPEYGQVAGGVTTIETTGGTDRWKFEVQDVEPRIRVRDGQVRGIESWTPRIAVGGPVATSRLTVFDSVEYQFVKTLVEGLPPQDADTRLEGISSFTQLDWQSSPLDHVSVAMAAFPQQREYLGLDTLNPRSVTPNLNQRGYLWTLSERRVLGPSSTMAFHVSAKQLDTDIYPSTPGPSMILAPDQNAGSYFNSQQRNSRRYEAIGEYGATPGALGGSHFVKVGGGVSHDGLNGTTENRPVVIVGRNGARLEQVESNDPAVLSSTKTDVFAFAQDSWSASSRLTLDYGFRYDHDTVAGIHHVAPRVGVSFVPTADRRIVIRGGAGLFFDKLTLNAATFDQLPERLVTRLTLDGSDFLTRRTIERPTVDNGRLQNPESFAWNVEVDRELTDRLTVRVGYQQRDGRRELIVDPGDGAPGAEVLLLSNAGRSRYRAFELTGRYRAAANSLVMSYVRSSATGDLNDLNSFDGNLENPIVRPNQYSRLSFDAPNRFLTWGEFELPRGFGIAPLVEVRDGFPLSVFDEFHDFIGGRNRAGRFPRFFSLDTQVWKHVTLPWPRGLAARVGIKVFNVTNHFNPRDFHGNLASSRFGEFSNGVSRTFRGKFVIDF